MLQPGSQQYNEFVATHPGLLEAMEAQRQSLGFEGKNYDGSPIRPDYQPGYNSNLSLFDMAQGQYGGINVDKTGLNQFRKEATRTGPSQWSTLAKSSQENDARLAREQGGRDVAGRTADARASLAMKGGLSGGATERIAKSGVSNYLDMSRNINAQKSQNNMQIDMNDERNRIQQLGMLPGMENQGAQVDLQKAGALTGARDSDVGRQLQENLQRNAFNMQGYHEGMSAWAAGQQANATENAGKK